MNNSTPIKVHIIGTGPHALVIADILFNMPNYQPAGFIEKDEFFKQTEKKVTPNLILPIYPQTKFLEEYKKNKDGYLVLGLGQDLISVRERLINELNTDSFCTVIHPSAVVATSVEIGAGTVVMAGAVLNPFVRVGRHVTINTGALIDHECEIEDNSFIQPGAHLAGNVKVRHNSIIGIGATIKERITIGSNSIVGGGAFVNKNVPDNVVYVGVPAKKLRNNYNR